MLDEFTRKIDEYAAAEAAYTRVRENKAFFAGDGYSPLGHTPTEVKLVIAELNRSKDALCTFILEHREEIRIDA